MRTAFIIIILSLSVMACGPSAEEALKYHRTLIIHHENARQAFTKLNESLEDTSWENIEAKAERFSELIHKEIYAIKNQPSFDDKEEYKTLIQNYLLELKYVGDHEVKNYIEFMQTSDVELSEKDKKYFKKLKPIIREKYQVAEDLFRHQQRLFTEKYGLTIE